MKKLLLVPVYCALFATLLFLVQGGFGGGHGRFDAPIFYLGVPAVLFGENWRWVPEFIENQSLFSVIWIPAAVNLVCVWLPIFLVASVLRKKKSKQPTA